MEQTPPPHDADTDTESPSSPSLSHHSHSSRSLDQQHNSSPPSPSSSPSPNAGSDEEDNGGLQPVSGHMDTELLQGSHFNLLQQRTPSIPAAVAHPTAASASAATAAASAASASSAVFHFDWVVDDFVALRKAHTERHYSPAFTLDGFTWRLLLFPTGNRAVYPPNYHDTIALYVQWISERSPTAPQHPHRFVLELVPPPPQPGREAVAAWRKESQHVFTAAENDRGFNPYIGVKELPAYLHGPQQALHVRVELERMRQAPSSAYNYLDATYDSKAMTGFVGLRNQGATCIAEGTPVKLADGTSLPIEEVRVGDSVLSYHAAERRLGTKEGLAAQRVQAVLDQGRRLCDELLFSDSRTLVCTPDHRIRTADGRWVEARKLVIDADDVAVSADKLISGARLPPLSRVRLVGRRAVGVRRVFDLSVPHPQGEASCSFVANGVVVHNCYMNSLLQTLYHVPIFRHLLYTLPTATDTSNSVPLSLQRVFYQLQTSAHAVSTKQLTAAFGWTSSESWQQHDVQEFSRVLLDNISERVKKTEMEGRADALFAGKSQMYVQCVHVPFKSERVETYLDLAMNVKGCTGLQQSFEQYVEVELLEKENAYRAEQFGLQDARKGSRFLTFPPILQLQLKRFEYNFERDMNVKVNDRFEFPTLLDLTPYLAASAASSLSDPPLYHLHSVLVHSGSGHGGHYFSYIRPFFDGVEYERGGWYKFDDETVVRATEEEATVGCYGGVPEPRGGGGGGYFPLGRMSLASSANAYMLVYVRQSVVRMTVQEIRREAALNGQPQKTAGEADGDKQEEKKEGEAVAAVQPPEELMAAPAAVAEVAEEKRMDVEATVEQAETAALPTATDDVKMSDTNLPVPAADMQTEPPALIPLTVPLPDALLSRFQREEKELAERQAAARRAALFTEVRLVSEQQLIELSERTGCGIELTQGKEEGEEFVYELPISSVKVLKTSTLREALTRQPESGDEDWQLATGIPLQQQQYWRITQRTNETERPNSYLPLPPATTADNAAAAAAAQQTVLDLKQKPLYVRSTAYDALYPAWSGGSEVSEAELENASKAAGDGGERCMVLVKWFDVERQALRWVGSVILAKSMLLSDVKRYVWLIMKRRGLWRDKGDQAGGGAAGQRVKMEVEGKESAVQEQRQSEEAEAAQKAQADGAEEDGESPDMIGWEEENVASDRITFLSDARTVKEAMLRNGDLLCFQHRYSDAEVEQLRARHTMSHSQQHTLPPSAPSPAALPPASLSAAFFAEVPHYLRYLYNRVSIEFRLLPYTPPSKERPSPANSVFRLELSKQHSYHDVMAALSAHTQVDAGRLSVHRPSLINKQQADYMSLDKTLHLPDGAGLLGRVVEQMGGEGLLYYQVLEFDPALLVEHYALNACYVGRHGTQERVRLLVKKKLTFDEASAVVRDRLRQLRRERREKEERDRQHQAHDSSDAATQQPQAGGGGDEMKEDSTGAAAAATSSSFPLDELDSSLASADPPALNYFCMIITPHERDLRHFQPGAQLLYDFDACYRHKHSELVMEEKTEAQVNADAAALQLRTRVLAERAARAQLVGGVADSSDDDSEDEEAEGAPPRSRLVDPAAPSLHYIFRFVPQTGSVLYRLYSHPFTVMLHMRTCTVRQLHALLEERLSGVEHAPLRVAMLRDKDWVELRADEAAEERDYTLAECTQRFQSGAFAVYDTVDAKADKARVTAQSAGSAISPYGQFGAARQQYGGLWRGNNASVKIYQQQ